MILLGKNLWLCKWLRMLGIQIFRHAVLMLVNNLGAAFRISLGPFLLAVGAVFIVIATLTSTSDQPNMDARFLSVLILLFAVLVLLFCWTAVAWHRYALLEESPGAFFPRWTGTAVKKYFGASVRFFFATLLVITVAGLALGAAVGAIGFGNFDTTNAGPAAFLINSVIGYFCLRFALVLPAAALGGRMKLGESWSNTGRLWAPIFVSHIAFVLFFSIPGWILQTPLGAPLSGFAYFALAAWLQTMVGISILTTLYGFIVEERDLR